MPKYNEGEYVTHSSPVNPIPNNDIVAKLTDVDFRKQVQGIVIYPIGQIGQSFTAFVENIRHLTPTEINELPIESKNFKAV